MDRAAAIFERSLDDIERRMGVMRADLSPGDIFSLVRACERAANPFDGVDADLIRHPVRVCPGVYFWPLTIGAIVWLEETADVWWADDPRMYRNALVYALLNARDPDAFLERSRRDVEASVRVSLRCLAATSAEVDASIARALGLPGEPQRPDGEGISEAARDWADLVAKIEARTGLPRERWLWGTSYAQTLRVYRHLLDISKASGGVHAKDELDDAMNALQTLKVSIMKRVKNG